LKDERGVCSGNMMTIVQAAWLRGFRFEGLFPESLMLTHPDSVWDLWHTQSVHISSDIEWCIVEWLVPSLENSVGVGIST
jgi:hypothetical protein